MRIFRLILFTVLFFIAISLHLMALLGLFSIILSSLILFCLICTVMFIQSKRKQFKGF